MLSKDLERLSELSRTYLNKNKDIIDIVLFGSAAKGKLGPGDIDAALIAKKSSSRAELTSGFTRFLSQNGFDVHVTTLFVEDILSEPLWSALIHDGVSLINQESLSQRWGYKPQTLFEFDASKLSNSDRVRFQYALVGRDGKGGLVHDVGGEKIGGNVIIAPVSKESTAMSFFDLWDVPSKIKRVLVS